MSHRALLLVALLSPGAVLADTAGDAFDELKRAVGVWRPAEKPDSKLRVTFALTAGGTVLKEEWHAPGHDSMTVYHRDGDALLATHYCPRGNQPRMALAGRDADGTLRFEFRDGTNLQVAGEYHEHILTLHLGADGVLTRGEVYAGNGTTPGPDEATPELTRFVRIDAAASGDRDQESPRR